MNILKGLFIIIVFLTFYSCDNKQKGNSTADPSAADSLSHYEQQRRRIPHSFAPVANRDSFLLRPFDLYKFKELKGGSNKSGAFKNHPYYYKPGTEGKYYHFFLFWPVEGYIGDTIIAAEQGLVITTFKPKGKNQYEYLDPTEELVEVSQTYNDFDLPELAYIGNDTTAVRNRLGKENFIQNDCFVYTHLDRALILGMEKGKVKWLKYVHLNAALEPGKEPKGLYPEREGRHKKTKRNS
jgi:hypothetical protein